MDCTANRTYKPSGILDVVAIDLAEVLTKACCMKHLSGSSTYSTDAKALLESSLRCAYD